jgi:hypothetical protein
VKAEALRVSCYLLGTSGEVRDAIHSAVIWSSLWSHVEHIGMMLIKIITYTFGALIYLVVRYVTRS